MKILIPNPRTSRYKEALYREALFFKKFDEFSAYYWRGLSIGIYWVANENPQYSTSAPLEQEYAKQGRLIAYISPEFIKTKYAVEIDISSLDPFDDITENKTQNTNSIKILRPDLIWVNYVFPIKKAVEVWKYNTRYLPRTEYELKIFWLYAHERYKKEQETGNKRKTRRRRRIKSVFQE